MTKPVLLTVDDDADVLAAWREDRGIADGWRLAGTFSDAGLRVDDLESLAAKVPAAAIVAPLFFIAGLMIQSSSLPRQSAIKVVENDYVVIWDVSGGSTHEHSLAALFVTMEPSREDAVGEYGSVRFFERDSVHTAEDPARTPRRAFLVELKEKTPPPDPLPEGVVAAWPRAGATKVLENELVVVWDYTFTDGVEIPLHYHDKDQVHVSLAPGTIRMIPLEGEPRVSVRKAGNANFVPRGALHREEYVDGGLRILVIQLKR